MTTLGRYTLTDVLHRGHHADVYAARRKDYPTSRFALKVPTSDTGVERILNAIAVLLRMGPHPHVVSLLDHFPQDDGRPAMVTLYYPAGTLRNHIATLTAAGKQFTTTQINRVALHIGRALDHARAAKVAYSDIRQDNIMVDTSGPGNQPRYVLGDWCTAQQFVGEGPSFRQPYEQSLAKLAALVQSLQKKTDSA